MTVCTSPVAGSLWKIFLLACLIISLNLCCWPVHSRCCFQQRSNLFNSHWKQLHKYFLIQSWAWISVGWEPQKAFIPVVPPYPFCFNSAVQSETYLLWQYLYCINKSLSPKPALSYSGVTVWDEMSVVHGSFRFSQLLIVYKLKLIVVICWSVF